MLSVRNPPMNNALSPYQRPKMIVPSDKRMSMIASACGFVFLAVAGCANAPAPDKFSPEPLSLSPGSLGRSLSLSQLVTGEYEGRTTKMRVEVEVTPQRLVIAGLSELGVTLFTLEQGEGEAVVTRLAEEQTRYDPRSMLFDLYLTYWPTQPLRDALSDRSMGLQEDPDGKSRTVFSANGEKLAKVVYPEDSDFGAETVIQHYNFPYRIRVVTLETRSQP
jgi:hypothetical protein